MKKSLFFGMAALLAAGVTSCKDDALSGLSSDSVLTEDQSFYVNVNITTNEAMTRDGGQLGDYDPETGWDPTEEPNFDKGTDDENAVKTIFLIFYDEDGKRVYTSQVLKNNDAIKDNLPNSINSLYQGIVQVDVKHGSKTPAYVMCFVNPITSQSFEQNPDFETMESLQKTTRPQIIDANGNFAMSKSVYFGVDTSKEGYDSGKSYGPSDYTKIIATPIEKGSLYDTYQEAKEALDASVNGNDNIINIYVERYAAKVNLKFTEGANYDLENVDGKKLTFHPEYWAVNAYESETFICKSFMNEEGTEDNSYLTMNTALGSSDVNTMPWFWNSPENHRSYWAQSPGYYKQSYPRVADDLLDFDAGHSVLDEGEEYGLSYYSYDDMVANSQSTAGIDLIRKARNLNDNQDKARPIYARENTTAGSALRNAANNDLMSPKAAVASIVLVGHYQVDGQNIPDEQTFWIMGNATNGYTYFPTSADVIKYLMNSAVHFSKNNTSAGEIYNYGVSNYGFNEGTEDYQKYFIMQHPTYDTRSKAGETAIVLDSRFEAVQIDKEEYLKDVESGTAPELYAQLNNRYQKVTAENIDEVNLQMFYMAGTAQGFKGGLAYFNIPIQHLGYYRASNTNYTKGLTATDKKFDWSAVNSGDFGLVRNHSYTIEVENINGLGNGIPDPSVPIVPPTDPEEYYIGARIIVLNWALVPTQKVTL